MLYLSDYRSFGAKLLANAQGAGDNKTKKVLNQLFNHLNFYFLFLFLNFMILINIMILM